MIGFQWINLFTLGNIGSRPFRQCGLRQWPLTTVSAKPVLLPKRLRLTLHRQAHRRLQHYLFLKLYMYKNVILQHMKINYAKKYPLLFNSMTASM